MLWQNIFYFCNAFVTNTVKSKIKTQVSYGNTTTTATTTTTSTTVSYGNDNNYYYNNHHHHHYHHHKSITKMGAFCDKEKHKKVCVSKMIQIRKWKKGLLMVFVYPEMRLVKCSQKASNKTKQNTKSYLCIDENIGIYNRNRQW